MLYANSFEIDITPPLGTIINGEFTCRYATEIADPLFAKALYLRDDKVSQLFIVVDICVMRREFLDPLKMEIEKLTGVPTSHQLISSTHTHYGGSVAALLMAHADLAYRELLRNRLLELALRVSQDAVPAKIGFGKINKPEHLTCRRYLMADSFEANNPVSHQLDHIKTNPLGSEDLIVERTTLPDSEVCYIGVKTLDDQWIGMLANYNLHYVGDCRRSTITADYFGYFSRKVKGNIGNSDMVVMMSNGTSGEVNIWDFIQGDRYPKEDHAKSKLIGEDIADAVCTNLDDIIWEDKADLAINYVDIELGLRKISVDDLEDAFELFSKTDYEALSYLDPNLMNKVYAREQVLLTAYDASIVFPIQCFKIGNNLIGGLGGEFFTETGVSLKSQFSNYFTICLANDYVGYVPPKHEIEKGGYETWRARSSFLDEEAEEKIRNKMVEILNELS